MFWKIKNYNEMSLGTGACRQRLYSGGWVFPRRIYFDGHECVMPFPDQYPSLPAASVYQPCSGGWSLALAICVPSHVKDT